MNTQQPSQDREDTATTWMTEQELITYAQCHNFSLSPTQMEHWYKEDCLPHPQQRHAVGQSGSSSYYPPHTAPQLLALCRLHERETRFTHLRVLLWLEGYDVPTEAVRESLLVVAEGARKALGQAIVRHPRDSLAAAEQIVGYLWPRKARYSLGRSLRSRLPNTDDQHTMLVMGMQLLLGGHPALETDYSVSNNEETELTLAEIFVRALGLEAAQKDRVGEVEPWLPRDVTPALTMLSARKLLSLTRAIRRLSKASKETFIQARKDREVFFELLPRWARAAQTIYGSNPFGLGMFTDMRSLAADNAEFMAMQVIGMVVARDGGFGEGIDSLATTMREQVELVEHQEKLYELICVELPDAAVALAAAIQSLRRGEKLQVVEERLREQSSQFKTQFEAFWSRHPELQIEMESDSVADSWDGGEEPARSAAEG